MRLLPGSAPRVRDEPRAPERASLGGARDSSNGSSYDGAYGALPCVRSASINGEHRRPSNRLVSEAGPTDARTRGVGSPNVAPPRTESGMNVTGSSTGEPRTPQVVDPSRSPVLAAREGTVGARSARRSVDGSSLASAGEAEGDCPAVSRPGSGPVPAARHRATASGVSA